MQKTFFTLMMCPVPAALCSISAWPGMNGLELQSELLRTGRSLPILFLTGHGDVAMAVDALKRGAADFIQKPVKAERLAALTHELVAWHQQYTQRLSQRRHAIEKLKALTPKELEVCRLAASGLSNKAIAKELCIAEQTVRIHRWSAAKNSAAAAPWHSAVLCYRRI